MINRKHFVKDSYLLLFVLFSVNSAFAVFNPAIVFSGDDYRDAAVVDYDDDGYVDIIIQRKVYRNNGDGTFTYKMTVPASPLESGGSSGDYTVWADFDGDGTRDVLVAGGVGTSMFVSPLRDRIHKVSLSGDGTPTLSSYHDIRGYDVDWVSTSSLYPSGTEVFGYNQNNTWGVALADVDKDGKVDMYLGRGRIGDGGTEYYGKDWLVKNNLTPANWNYYEGTNGAASATVDITNTVGMTRTNQRWCPDSRFSHAEGASATDYNFDGNPDFFIPSYRMLTNYLWRGAWNGSSFYFDNAADQCGVQSSTDVDLDNYSANGNGTGIYWYDYDNDGDLDFIQVRLSHYYVAFNVTEWALRLWVNDGDGTFTKRGTIFHQISLMYTNHYRGVGIGDYDNDGDLDVYVTHSIQPGQTPGEYSVGRLYKYDSVSDTYTKVEASENLDTDSHNGNHGAVFVDYNNDGKLDLFTTRSYNTGSMGNSPEIWRNDGNWSGNYLFVRLFPPATYNGKPINSDAINAMVQIWIDKNGNDTRDAGETLTRQQLGYNTGHMWVGPQPIHFGLGSYNENHIKWIRVLWPGIAQNVGGWEYYAVADINTFLYIGDYALNEPILSDEPSITYGTTNEIFWSLLADADEYYAECAEGISFTTSVQSSGWITDTNYEFTGLRPSYNHWFRVKARNTSAESAWSESEKTLHTIYPDYYDDGDVDITDLSYFVENWLDTGCNGSSGDQSDWCWNTDLNGDGKVNFDDFAMFTEYWLDDNF